MILTRTAAVVSVLTWLVLGSSALAFQEDHHALPNFDRRTERVQPAPAASVAARARGEEKVRRVSPHAKVSYDEITGFPSYVGSTHSFLKSEAGAAVHREPAAVIRQYLDDNVDLFPRGGAILDTARLSRDDQTKQSGLRTFVWQQELDGIPIFRTVFKAHLSARGELINLGGNLVAEPAAAANKAHGNRAAVLARPRTSASQAIKLAATSIGEQVAKIESSGPPVGATRKESFNAQPILNMAQAELTWLPMDAGTLRLAWDVTVVSRAQGKMYRFAVDAQTGEVVVRICLTAAISNAQYRVFTGDSPTPLSPGWNTPNSAQPPLVPRTVVTLDAIITNASPNGWINDGNNSTAGNNAVAHLDLNGDDVGDPGTQVGGSPFRVFDYAMNLPENPSNYVAASIVNAFYWNNWVHDKLYELGFTESAGNFQANNFGRGGSGGDAVQVDVRDSLSLTQYNNAYFSTPADGSAPRMHLLLMSGPTPDRDSALDTEVLIHEYCHGLSTRLVGGGVGISALQATGMGEGWGDFYALSMLAQSSDNLAGNYAWAAYSFLRFGGGPLTNNYYHGIRRYPYSTNMTVNPLTFKDIDPAQAGTYPGIVRNPAIGNAANEVHNMGEVWAVALWEARARFIGRLGFDVGNQRILQIVTDGMKLSPANPNFLQARDAVLQAAQVLALHPNDVDDLWAAFAKRGMGFSATSPASTTTAGVVEAYDLPPDSTRPIVTVTFPAHNASLVSFDRISGTASEVGSGIESNVVQFTLYRNGQFWNGSGWGADMTVLRANVLTNGTWSYTNVPPINTQGEGTYLVSAFARDSAGNVSSPSSGVNNISFTVDREAPEVAISNPPNGTTITNFSVVSGTASDSGGLQVVRLYILRLSDNAFWDGSAWAGGGSAILPTTISGESWTSSGPLPNPASQNPSTGMPNGSYNFIAFAIDRAGNQTRADSIVTLDHHPIYTWTAGSWSDSDPNNNNNDWGNPANWSPYGVPPQEANVFVNGNPEARYLGLIDVHGINHSGGTLHASNITVKFLTQSAGRLHLENKLQLADNGVFRWNGGELYGGGAKLGSFNVPTNGTVTISNSAGKATYSMTFNNSGTVRWYDGHIYGDESVINNGPTGLWEAHAANVLNFYPNFGPGNRGFVNRGTFRKRGSVETAHQGYFNNFGVLETEAGLFTVYDAMRWEDGSRITGGGTVRLVNGCCGAAATIAGNTTLEGTFELSEWNTYIRGAGLISLPSNAVLKVSAGYVGGNVNISGNGQIAWTGGGFDGTNTVWTYVNVSGNGTKYFNRNGNPQFTVLNNLGIINWSGSGAIHGWARGGWSEKPGMLNNYGEIRFLNDGTPFVRDGDYTTLNNFGTLVKIAGTNETTLHSFRVNNHARIVAETGTLAFVDEVFLHTNSFLSGLGRIRLAGAITASNDVTASGLVRMDGGWFNCVTNTNGVALAKWSGTNTFEFAGGTLYGHHTFSNHVTFNITGNATKFLGSATTLDNYGRMTWSGTGRLFMWARSGWSEYPSRIHNRPGATFELLTDGYPFQRDGDYSFFTNHPGALVVKTGGSNNTTIDSIQFANAGELRADVGTNQFTDVLHMRPGGRFTGAGAHHISGGGHTVYGTNVIDGTTVQHSGGWITGNSNSVATLQTINNGLWTWSGGGIAERMAWAGTFDITGNATKQFGSGAVLENSAYVRWSGLGHIWNQGRLGWNELPATWNNLPLAVFEALDDGVLSFDGSPCTFNNSALATFRKTGGTNTIVYWVLNNAGNVQSYAGRIELAGGGLGTGTFLADNGARVKFTGGTYKLENALLTGQGLFQVDGATVTTAGNLGFGSGSSTTLELISGTINGAASFVGNPVVNWTGGSLAGTQHIAAGSVMNISGGRKFLASATVLNNQGTINWSGPGDLYAWARSGYSELPSTINNFAGATFRFLTDGTPFIRDGSYCTFNNHGTFVKSGGTEETTIHSFVLNNFGSVIAESGTLAFVDYANLGAGSQLNGQSRIRFAGYITANDMVTASGLVRMDGGWFDAPTNASGAPLSAWFGTNTFEWVGGTLYGHHTLGVGVTFNIADNTSPTTKFLGSATRIDNHGVMTWSGAGRIHAWARGGYSEYPSIINNRPGATFRFLNDGWPFGRDGDYSRFTNYAGALVVKSGGTNRTTIDSYQFANSGEVRSEVGTIEFSDVLHLQNGGMLSGTGTNLITGGNHTVRGITTINSRVRMENGTVIGSAGGTLGGGAGSFEWAGGYIGGEFTFGAGLKSMLSGANTKAFSPGSVITNAGELVWTGGDIWSPGRSGWSEAIVTFNNLSGAAFIAAGDNAFSTWERPHTFNNAAGATFVKSNSVGTTTCNWFFNNAGTMDLQSGTVALNIQPTTFASGTLRFMLGGPAPGTNFGRLALPGVVDLGGVLNVALTSGYMPTNGESFSVISYGGRNGQFSTISLPPLPAGFEWLTRYSASAMTLSPRVISAMVGHWKFDEGTGTVVSDSSPLRNHGTLVNPKPSTWVPGVQQGGLYFDGTTGAGSTYIRIENDVSLQLSTGATFVAWVRCDNVNRDAPIFVKEGDGKLSYWFGTHGPAKFGVLLDLDGNQPWTLFDRDNGSIPQSQWIHLASTWDGTVIRHYQNGAQVDQTAFAGTLNASDSPLIIGANFPYNTTAFQGTLDEMRLYNRALTVSEIQELYAAVATPRFITHQGIGISSGQFGFTIQGYPGQTLVIEGSTNLVDWLPLSTNVIGNGTSFFSDPNTSTAPTKFYRLRTP